MPIDITMPRLSDTMEAGTVIKWNVKPGDKVSPGMALADIETDKATMELQAFDEGVVGKILVKEGDSVPVGEKILILAQEGEKIEDRAGADRRQADKGVTAREGSAGPSAGGPARPATGGATAVAAPADDDAADVHHAANGERLFVSPLARKIAEESGLDLSTVKGSGPSGRIVRRDVEEALRGGGARTPAPQPAMRAAGAPAKSAPGPAPAPARVAAPLQAQSFALSNMRRTIAKRLVESKSTIPHYQVTVSVDMDPLLELRAQLNEQLSAQGVKLSVNDFLVRACALAMHQHPHVNARWNGAKPGQETIELLAEVNVGVAIALPIEKGGGLVVATLRSADRMGLRQISQDTKALAEKARTRGLTVEEMADGTFTISNLGMYNVEHFTAIINPPQAAILAVGGAVKKPVVREIDGEDEIVIGHEMQMTMSSDHRIIDGAMAAEYLNTVKQLLEKPAALLV